MHDNGTGLGRGQKYEKAQLLLLRIFPFFPKLCVLFPVTNSPTFFSNLLMQILFRQVMTGGVMTKASPASNPCRRAYIDFNVRGSCCAYKSRAGNARLCHCLPRCSGHAWEIDLPRGPAVKDPFSLIRCSKSTVIGELWRDETCRRWWTRREAVV